MDINTLLEALKTGAGHAQDLYYQGSDLDLAAQLDHLVGLAMQVQSELAADERRQAAHIAGEGRMP